MSAERSGPAICNVSNIGEGKDEMTKASIDLQDLRRRIYVKAKAEPSWRFWGLYVHVCKMETLRAAYEMAKRNDGAPGIDGVTFEAIEAQGVEARRRGRHAPSEGYAEGFWLSNLYLNEVDKMLERA